MNNAQRVENAIKWIDKLLTTRMKQGRTMLGNSKSGYCCLGVGCKTLGVGYNPFADSSAEFRESVGLIDEIGGTKNKLGASLVRLNDGERYAFKQIAKEILEDPSMYFTPAVAKGIRRHYGKQD